MLGMVLGNLETFSFALVGSQGVNLQHKVRQRFCTPALSLPEKCYDLYGFNWSHDALMWICTYVSVSNDRQR